MTRKRYIKCMGVLVFFSILTAIMRHEWSYLCGQAVLGYTLWSYWDYIQRAEQRFREIQEKAHVVAEKIQQLERQQP